MFTSLKVFAGKSTQLLARYGLATVMVFVLSLSVLVLVSHDAHALRITMKRIIFEGPRRTELLTIINNTPEEQTYRLGWRRMRMTESQSVLALEDNDPGADLKLADEMVRYAPRRIVLAPGASQQVRLMLRRPKDLADGEYRSHFWIEPEAEAVKFTPSPEAEAGKGPAVQIKMLTGMTLPVFVRSGNLTASASITDVKVVPAGENLKVSFTLHREGTRSIYGDLRFFCGGVTEKPHKEIRGIAVYTEVTKRLLTFQIPAKQENGAPCSQVSIQYIAPDDDLLFKGGIMAEAVSG